MGDTQTRRRVVARTLRTASGIPTCLVPFLQETVFVLTPSEHLQAVAAGGTITRGLVAKCGRGAPMSGAGAAKANYPDRWRPELKETVNEDFTF